MVDRIKIFSKSYVLHTKPVRNEQTNARFKLINEPVCIVVSVERGENE